MIMTPAKNNSVLLLDSAKICLQNAKRLLNDADMLEFEEPPATALALCILSQEESAKAFLLFLIACGAIPWNQYVRKSLNDHRSKQLMTIILNQFEPSDDEFDKRMKGWMEKKQWPILEDFIHNVGDVLNIYYYERIERWRVSGWVWDDELHYDPAAKSIHDGALDKVKQHALYVNIGKNGQAFPASATKTEMETAKEAARRYHSFVSRLIEEDKIVFQDWLDWLKEAFKMFFAKHGSMSKAPSQNNIG